MRGVWRWQAALVASVVVAAGCSTPGSSAEESPEVAVMTAGATLHDPVWSYRDSALVGLTGDGRIAEVSDVLSGHATTRLSPPLSPGRNLQISRKNEQHVFVPQPQRNKVAVLDLGTMRAVDEFDAGPAPAYLSEDSGMRVLLALSADGSSVTPVDEYGFLKMPTAHVAGEPCRRSRRLQPWTQYRVPHLRSFGSPLLQRTFVAPRRAWIAGDGCRGVGG